MTKTTLLLASLLLFFVNLSLAQSPAVLKGNDDVSQTPQRSVTDNGINGIEVGYSFSEPQQFQKKHRITDYVMLSIADFSHLQEVGKPALPSHIDLVAIPDGAEYKLTINNDIPMVKSSAKVYPALKPARDTQGAKEPEFEINKEFYETDLVYPQQSVQIIGEMKYRGIRMLMVQVCPVQYNPATSKLYIHSDINYEIEFSGATSFTDYSIHTKSFMDNIQHYPLNSKSFSQESNKYYSQNAINTTAGSKNYIIITHSDFDAAADSIANWKRQLGYSVEVVSAATWTAAQVRDAVHTRYQNWTPKPDYLLIIGDDDDVPAETYYTNDSEAFGSDLYFVCMDGNGDYVPDMAKGRISPSDAANAMMQVHKIINYERNPIQDSAFYTNGLNCAQFQDDDDDSYADRRFLHTSENIRDYVMSLGYNNQRIYYTDDNVLPLNYNYGYYSNGQNLPSELLKTNGFDWTGGAAEIASAINQGKFFVFHRDHGYAGGSGWAHPYFVNSSISNLNNGDKLPVVFSINCHTGEFTLNSCFAETFMRRSTGGSVGIFAASFYSYSGYNDGFSIGLIDGLWSNPGLIADFGSGGNYNPTLTPHDDIIKMGDLLNHGLTRMVQTWGSSRYTNELFHYFGDPSMRIWKQKPDSILASVVDTIGCNSTSFTVSNCNVSDAVATITGNGFLLGKTTLVNGNGVIPVSGIVGPYVYLTISAPNMRPLVKKLLLGSGGSLSLYTQSGNNICYNSNIADIEIYPGCGTPPYQILWNTGDTINRLENVSSGIYTVVVTDASNVIMYDTITVSGPTSAMQISSSITDAKCYFSGSGNIETSIVGGNAPYDISWSTGQSDVVIDNIPAGTYTINVVDSFGCEVSETFTVSQPTPLNMTTIVNDDATGNCEGSATSLATGGTPPYSYLWNDPANQTTATAIGVCQGLLKVILTDDNDCYLNRTLMIKNTVGVESAYSDDEFTISPNPSNTGIFIIDFSENIKSNTRVMVYNSLGEIIINDRINTDNLNNKKIDLSSYAQGVYFLQIGDNKVFKLIYQK